MFNAMEVGSKIPILKHDHTPETYILLRGSMRVNFCNTEGTVTESAILDPKAGTYGIDIPAGQLHTVEVLEPGTMKF